MNAKECRFCKHCDVNRTNDIGRVRCTRFSRYVGKFNCCDYFITKESEKLFDAITKKDKFAEKRKPRKSRSSKNRKPYGTSKHLCQILNGKKTQNDIIAEFKVKELNENA